jgi:hypothetical protein
MGAGNNLSGRKVRWGRTIFVVVALVAVAAPASSALAKKKGHGKVKTFASTLAVNKPIPDATAGVASTPVRSTITVPKKYKGKLVADVNVTGIQTTGSGTGAANDLRASLTAPNGRTLTLFEFQGDQNLGPWTLDDDTATSICNTAVSTPCTNPNQTLHQPFAGTSNLAFNDAPALVPLANFDGVRMNGTWTFTIVDIAPPGTNNGTSSLNQWGLQITPKGAS